MAHAELRVRHKSVMVQEQGGASKGSKRRSQGNTSKEKATEVKAQLKAKGLKAKGNGAHAKSTKQETECCADRC